MKGKKYTAKITLPTRISFKIDEETKLFRQAKVKRTQNHPNGFTTDVKGTYIVKKYKRRKKIYKINPKQL